MKPVIRFILLGLALLLGCFASTASAGVYSSPIGFAINLSSDWEVVNQQTIESQKGLETELRSYNIDVQVIRLGHTEVYINRNTTGQGIYWIIAGKKYLININANLIKI